MMRTILGLFLSLVLSLSSVSMAVARTQAPAAGQITICSGYGFVSVSVDAEGNPVGPVHLCPDCLMGMGLAVLPDPVVQQRPEETVAILRLASPQPAAAQAEVAPQARGPPGRI